VNGDGKEKGTKERKGQGLEKKRKRELRRGKDTD
jgi:hypothetical protein